MPISSARKSASASDSPMEADVLTERQKEYAAIDAWACINLYDEIMNLLATKEYELEVVPEEKPAADNNS